MVSTKLVNGNIPVYLTKVIKKRKNKQKDKIWNLYTEVIKRQCLSRLPLLEFAQIKL